MTAEQNTVLLEYQDGHLQLRNIAQSRWQPVWIDFNAVDLTRRRIAHQLYQEFLVRAVGAKPNQSLRVVDVTAGFGEDGFLLASAGCRVTLLERSPVMFALLQDGLKRAQQQPLLADIIQRMDLCSGDARDWLVHCRDQIDVIYLDPMFPERKKSALVKKEMRLLNQLVGTDEDAGQLLTIALQCAHRRVVVKRPAGAPYLNDMAPQGAVVGKRCRYDLYAPQRGSARVD